MNFMHAWSYHDNKQHYCDRRISIILCQILNQSTSYGTEITKEREMTAFGLSNQIKTTTDTNYINKLDVHLSVFAPKTTTILLFIKCIMFTGEFNIYLMRYS